MPQHRTPWPVATRVSLVVAYQELLQRFPRLSGRRFCAATEVPYATFARWWRQFQVHGPHGLADRPKRPKHSPTALPGATLDTIRHAHRGWTMGVRRLHAELRAAGRITCSVSSVYRSLSRAGALTPKPRRPKPVWIRYAKAHPGERAQMDLKYLPEDRFMLTLVDDCSRLVAATVLTQRTSAVVAAALPDLLAQFPFPIQCIQTDNGPEFGTTVQRTLASLGIRQVRIRPRTPHLNGKVERVQRTIQEEFWDAVGPGSVDAWTRGLRTYLRYYNERRLHSALAYLTPMAYARDRLPAPSLSHLS